MPSLYETITNPGDVSSSNFTTLYNASGLSVPNAGAGAITGNLNVSGNLTVQGSSNLIGPVILGGTLSTPNYTFPLPDGATDQVMVTDGSGNLHWVNIQAIPGADYQIEAGTTTGGANLTLFSAVSSDSVKFASGSNITVVRTDNNTITINGLAYNIDASATTGGANLNLTSGATTDTVKFAGGRNITVSQTDASTITIATNADDIPDGTANGQMLVWENSAWTATNNVVADATTATRTTFTSKVLSTTPASLNASQVSVVADYAAQNYVDGAGAGMVFAVDSDAQALNYFSTLSTSYYSGGDGSNIRLGTSTDGFTNHVATSITGGNTLVFSSAHGFSVNTPIRYRTTTSNGLVQDQIYYVIAAGFTTTQCQISLTQGGSAVALTNGTGLTLYFQNNANTLRLIVANANNTYLNGSNLVLRANNTGSPAANAQFTVERGSSGADAYMKWNEANGRWEFNEALYASGIITIDGDSISMNNDNTAIDSYLNFKGFGNYLKWNNSLGHFQFSNALDIAGELTTNSTASSVMTVDSNLVNPLAPLILRRTYSNPTIPGNIGTTLSFQTENSVHVNQVTGYIDFRFDNTTAGNEYSSMNIGLLQAGVEPSSTGPDLVLNTAGIEISGNTLTFNRETSGAPTTNAQVVVKRGTSPNASITWDEGTDEWEFNENVLINKTNPFLSFSTQPTGSNPQYGIRGISTLNDPWFVGAGATTTDEGYLELATGDNAGTPNEASPIYVRQYNGYASGGVPWYGGGGTVVNQLTLLDNNGNTSIPHSMAVNTNTLYVDATTGRVGVGTNTPSYTLDVQGNIGLTGDVAVNGGDITTTATTFNLVNTTATTVNLAGAATTVSIGANTGTTTINNDLVADSVTVSGNLVAGKGLYAKGAMDATFTDGIVVDYTPGLARISTGAADILSFYNNGVGNALLGQFSAVGDLLVVGDLAVNGGDVTTVSSTGNLFNTNAVTVNIAGAATAVNIGATTGSTTVNNDLVVHPTSTAPTLQLGSQANFNAIQTTTTAITTAAITATTRNAMSGTVNIKDNVTGAFHVVNFTALRNGATAMLTTYGELYTGSALANFTADISGGSVRLLATPASANSTTFNVVRTSIT